MASMDDYSQQQYLPRLDLSHAMQPARISEGSSCSDVDGSLKRSKRARRPNKFYGYTSDDENMGNLGQSLMIGMQCIKPTPPPQLTWHKEDLPTPSKSINRSKVLNNKNKLPRASKMQNTTTPAIENVMTSGLLATKKQNKRTSQQSSGKSTRKRPIKKKENTNDVASDRPEMILPPIPKLKILPSQIMGTNNIPAQQIYSSSKESDDDDDDNDDDDEDDEDDDTSDSSSSASETQVNITTPNTSAALTQNMWNTSLTTQSEQHQQQQQQQAIVPPIMAQQTEEQPSTSNYQPPNPVLPPVPEVTAFKQKIPPALMPNPDFATLQYFKANNIRYPIRPPAGARLPRDGEAVYCYCRCPYDEVSEMIACDGDNCIIEWFHFECVGIMVAPQGKWFCAECRPNYSEELYPTNRC